MDGVINVLKPSGMTSHDVVYFIRKVTKIKKVGHAGTLDPLAVGVLPILVGRTTKFSNYLMEHDKTYRVHICFGIETSTYDCEGDVIAKSPEFKLECDNVYSAISSFVGEIEQTPPMFSAIKVNGEKLYNAARKGREIEVEKRKVTIYSIENIYQISDIEYSFDVKCSKGTYIRSLCVDIGKKLGVFAYMNLLVRIQTGEFNIEDAFTLEEIEQDINKALILPDKAIDFPKAYVADEVYKNIINGQKKSIKYLRDYVYSKDEAVRLYSNNGDFIGIGEVFTDDNRKLFKVAVFV